MLENLPVFRRSHHKGEHRENGIRIGRTSGRFDNPIDGAACFGVRKCVYFALAIQPRRLFRAPAILYYAGRRFRRAHCGRRGIFVVPTTLLRADYCAHTGTGRLFFAPRMPSLCWDICDCGSGARNFTGFDLVLTYNAHSNGLCARLTIAGGPQLYFTGRYVLWPPYFSAGARIPDGRL